jgi:hypothetical protein
MMCGKTYSDELSQRQLRKEVVLLVVGGRGGRSKGQGGRVKICSLKEGCPLHAYLTDFGLRIRVS